VKREEAIAILREIVATRVLRFNWVSLENGKSDCYELHIKPEITNSDWLKPIVEKHNLALKEVNGLFIIYGEYEEA
jgi:hypothetical protein